MDVDYMYFFILIWVGLGIWGMVKIIKKGYLADSTCAVWGLLILVGWWAIPILLGLGPIWLGIAALLEERKRCPHCRKMIPASATKCAYCQSDIVMDEDLRQHAQALGSSYDFQIAPAHSDEATAEQSVVERPD